MEPRVDIVVLRHVATRIPCCVVGYGEKAAFQFDGWVIMRVLKFEWTTQADSRIWGPRAPKYSSGYGRTSLLRRGYLWEMYICWHSLVTTLDHTYFIVKCEDAIHHCNSAIKYSTQTHSLLAPIVTGSVYISIWTIWHFTTSSCHIFVCDTFRLLLCVSTSNMVTIPHHLPLGGIERHGPLPSFEDPNHIKKLRFVKQMWSVIWTFYLTDSSLDFFFATALNSGLICF
jgi:hypothetical protein